MKIRLISTFIFAAILGMFLCSCNTIFDTIDSNIETTFIVESSTQNYIETNILSVEATDINSSNIDNPITPSANHSIYASLNLATKDLFENDTRIYRFSSMKYYNKLDGETYSLCFDPTCSHIKGTANPNCPVVAFAGSNFA